MENMRKSTTFCRRCITLGLCLIISIGLIAGCGKDTVDEKGKNGELTEITLNEVAHSLFYAPMYVAIEEGYFAKEGLALTVITGFGVIRLVQNFTLFKKCIYSIPFSLSKRSAYINIFRNIRLSLLLFKIL